MTEIVTIDPAVPKNIGLDYSALKEEGIAIIQALAGDIWTDYNEHDPGVTILEQLSYGLTELSYRAEFPVRDLLTNEFNNEIDSRRQALYLPQDMLPCNPVTVNDYRKLIIDRVKGIRNVWLTPDEESPDVRGLYRIALYVPDEKECVCDANNLVTTVSQQVAEVYGRHRDISEDLAEIFLLTAIPTRVEARVAITESVSPERTLARIFFQLGLLLAPEIERSSLQRMIDKGETAEIIFDGPLLLHGLIDDDQMKDKPFCIPVTEISNRMLMVEGVINISDLMVVAPAQSNHPQKKTYSGNDSIPIPISSYLELDTSASGRHDSFSISLFVNGVSAKVNARRVERELEKLWKSFRRPYSLALEYAHYFALPGGTYRDVKQYYSIQNQFPNLYGINQYGVDSNNIYSVQPAQAKQLKGYLLAFDQILANYFAQLAHIKDLYSVDSTLDHTYFYQYLDHSVPDVEPLLKKGARYNNYHHGLPRIIQSEDNFDERRNRFLNVMLAIYGQTLEQIGLSADDGNRNSHYSQRLIDAKITWLRHLIAGTQSRGRAFDYLGRASGHNMSGMEIKIRIQLDMAIEERTPLSQLCAELGLEIVETNDEATIGKKLDTYSDYLEGQFSSITSIGGSEVVTPREGSTDAEAGEVAEVGYAAPHSLLHGQRLSEEFLHAAADTMRFQIGSYSAHQKVAFVCRTHDDIGWHFIESYRSEAQAKAVAGMFIPTLQTLQRNCRQIYLVEHILLRFASYDRDTKSDSRTPEQDNFDYSFTLSAVVSATREQRTSSAYRKAVSDVIRENTPSHLLLNVYFVSPHALCRFEKIYWSWRQALKTGGGQRIITSNRLKHFLQTHHANTPMDENTTP